MANYESLTPFPEDYEKRGQTALIEAAVQEALDNRESTNEILAALKEDLTNNEQRHDAITATFEIERRYAQAVISVASFVILADAFPRITAWHQKHGTLRMAQREQDAPHLSEPIALATHWFLEPTNYVMEQLKAQKDPIITHLAAAKAGVNDAYRAWKSTPVGQRSWPSLPKGATMGNISSLAGNAAMASDVLATFAVYASVHRGLHRPEHLDELMAATKSQALPRTVWLATAHRHLMRTEENFRLTQEGRVEEAKLFIPEYATSLLTYESIAQRGLVATVREFTDRPMARDAQFCPHPSLRDGPVKNAHHCAGAIVASYSDPADRRAAQVFFEEMGLKLGADGKFSTALAVTALTAVVHRDTLQPEWLKIAGGQYSDIESGAALFEAERQRCGSHP